MLARKLTGLAAAALTLGLVAATTTGDRAVGTALTDMTAVEFEVTGLDAVSVPALTIADIGTFASTDTDAVENVLGNGVPFASANIVPVAIGSDALGAVEARSDGTTSRTGSALDQVVGLLDIAVNPATVAASATEQDAAAFAELATAQVESVAAVLGLDFTVNTAGIASRVSQTAASATQGLNVTGLNLTLGDLLPADLLGQLPLGTLIELLQSLPVELSVDVQAIVDALTDAVSDVDKAVTALGAASSSLTDAVAAALDTEALVEELTVDAAVTDLTELAALVVKYATECPLAGNIIACVEGLLADAEAQLVVDLDAVTEAVGVVVTLIGDLGDALNDLVAALNSADGIDIDGLLEAIAAGELLDIGAIQVGVIANATDAVETTTATVGCNEVPVRALGIDIVTPSCREPLETTSAVAAQVTGALEDVVGILPLVADIVPDVRFGMFTDLVESTRTDGAYNRATAGVTALELGIDPVTLCADCIVDGLLEDVLGLAGQVLDTVEGALPEDTVLDGLGLIDLVDDIDGAAAALPDLDTLTATVQGLLDALPLGDLVEDVTVPGFDLVVDPVSTASFAVVPAAPVPTAPPAAPTTPGSPTTPGAPSLPTTGGGFALLGGLLAAGALAFRRRG